MWSHFKHLSLEWGGWFELLRQSGFLSTSTPSYSSPYSFSFSSFPSCLSPLWSFLVMITASRNSLFPLFVFAWIFSVRHKFVFYGGRYECVMFLKSDIRANLCNSLSENLRVPVSTFQYLEWRGSRRANTAPISSLISNRGQSTRPQHFYPRSLDFCFSATWFLRDKFCISPDSVLLAEGKKCWLRNVLSDVFIYWEYL